jgi:hypothetical protein
MTEAEWLACEDSGTMLAFLRGPARDRKLRLFAAACARLVWNQISEPKWRKAVEIGEQFADGLVTSECREAASRDMAVMDEHRALLTPIDQHRRFALNTNVFNANAIRGLCHCPTLKDVRELHLRNAWINGFELTGPQQPGLIRDIFGLLPFRTVTLAPAWRTATVTSLAQAIYDERAFDRLLILADALEDAGCTHADILGHCRAGGAHVRGCWVVDLILRKG